jgi:Asp-tRNA(Asn)/Glu-tRNA(Gln) amidotransferase A subunit family amidase
MLKRLFPLLACLCWAAALKSFSSEKIANSPTEIGPDMIVQAESLLGLTFSDAHRELMLPGLKELREKYASLRTIDLSNSVAPALVFDPIPLGATFEKKRSKPRWSSHRGLKRPADAEQIAFLSVGELASLIRTRQISSEELTGIYMERLKRLGPRLECVVTLTENLALEQARRADREIAAGKYRGPLHGIPYGAKDLLATKGIPTTWGTPAFQEQVFAEDATVVRRLEEAGAVLVAKLTLGELAWGDVWFGGKTRNPWNTEHGSSGSSAGSAAATAAGLVAFAIGSETWGSIVSPATVCGVTGLRPTFGRVSRHGAMTLSWSMDKIGPICRTVEDCALVFEAIHGPDGLDPTIRDLPFNYSPRANWGKLRIGYLKEEFELQKRTNDLAALKTLESLGARLIPIRLPEYPVGALSFILGVEAAAAFDFLTRNGMDEAMVRQTRNAWPNVFRQSRLVPAVEYLQANRVRFLLVQEMARLFEEVDLYVAPSHSDNLLLTNLTGHPCVVVPNGFNKGLPTSISFTGRLFREAELLAVTKAFQDATDFHKTRPGLNQDRSRELRDP